MTAFGHALRALWSLGDGIFLNHGSFGACPLEVVHAQDALRAEMEAQPANTTLMFQITAVMSDGSRSITQPTPFTTPTSPC